MPLWGRNSSDQKEVPPPRHLPLPTGPHAVGYQDVMTAGGVEEGVFVRLYYPSIHPLNETINQHHLWPVWAEDEYLVGFVKFMQAMLAKWPSWAPRSEFMFIDQMSYIAPMMHIGCKHVWKLLNGTVHCPIIRNAPISQEKKWPVIVFSHGLGCNRFAYSRICTDLASHGYLVAATEHRDGSSSLSYYMTEEGQRAWIPHRRVLQEEKEYLVRNSQLQFRCQEVQRTLELVLQLSSGDRAVQNVLTDPLQDLHMFRGRLDTSSPIAAGHSFGGATTLLGLSKEPRFSLGVVLDGWLFPMKEEALTPTQPILFVNTESFMNRQNILKMREFLTNREERRMVFIKGSVHQNHIDAPLIFKSITIKKIIGMHSETDPHTVLDINNKLMVHFIRSRLSEEDSSDLVEFLEHHQEVLIEATDSAPGEEDKLLEKNGRDSVEKKLSSEKT